MLIYVCASAYQTYVLNMKEGLLSCHYEYYIPVTPIV